MNTVTNKIIAIIGAGPAGLMAAEMLSASGVQVHLYDAMPSVGRKFLLAGLGGLNLTHSEPYESFITRYAERSETCASWIRAFDANAICKWAKGLGVDTFVGSSQRIFPTDMKAAPLLRAWLHRLRQPQDGLPVAFHMRHRWNGALHRNGTKFEISFDTSQGKKSTEVDAVLLALGGGSWRKLGSDGAWQPWLSALGLELAPLRPANCGFDVLGCDASTGWSRHISSQFAGSPLKSVGLSFTNSLGEHFNRRGEFVLTNTGIEGNLVYAASALLRDEIDLNGLALLHLDLKPDLTHDRVLKEVSHPRGSRSLSSHLKSRLNLSPLHLVLLHEILSKEIMNHPVQLAAAIKHLPITLTAPRPIDEAISSAGGVRLEAIDASLMVKSIPGLFIAGEMLDWEAPTGGYLLSACLASGRLAGLGAASYLI